MSSLRRALGLAALLFVPALATSGGSGAAFAQESSLPSASEIVARYQEAIGGRDAVLRKPSSRALGRVEIPAAGFAGTFEIVYGGPGRVLTVMDIAGAGEIRTVVDGSRGWMTNPMTGPMLMDDETLEQTRLEADVRARIREGPNVVALETVEQTERNGEACYRVRVVWATGRETFDCYSVDSGLLIATEGFQQSPMGAADVTVLLSDYREFDGILVATRIVHRTLGLEQVMVIDTVEYGPVDPALFAPPPDIQVLLQAAASP